MEGLGARGKIRAQCLYGESQTIGHGGVRAEESCAGAPDAPCRVRAWVSVRRCAD